MIEILQEPWPWYIAGPMLGFIIPILLLIGGKEFGISSNFRHLCTACLPGETDYFDYDWKETGAWNFIFIAGTMLGGFIAGWLLNNPEPIDLSRQTISELQAMGVTEFGGMMPDDIFNWRNLGTWQGWVVLIGGGFLIGFGARYAGGCTSGHTVMGLANLQMASLQAAAAFFIGGLIVTYIIYPLIV